MALSRIREIIAEESIGVIVLGLPLTLRGEEGPEAQRVRGFEQRLLKAVAPVPVETIDERLTSAAVDQMMGHAVKGRTKTRRRGSSTPPRRDASHRDAVAASLILETWLARRRRLNGRHPNGDGE